jgi:hypothetical protein
LSPVQEQFKAAIEGHGGAYRMVASYEDITSGVDDLERRTA